MKTPNAIGQENCVTIGATTIHTMLTIYNF